MRRSVGCAFLLLVVGAVTESPRAEDSFRCGSRIIEVGMTQADVLESCGEPASRTVESQDVRSGNRVTGTTQLHRWTYESYSASRVLLFDQERLISIE